MNIKDKIVSYIQQRQKKSNTPVQAMTDIQKIQLLDNMLTLAEETKQLPEEWLRTYTNQIYRKGSNKRCYVTQLIQHNGREYWISLEGNPN